MALQESLQFSGSLRGLDQMGIRGGPYLLLGEVLGHSALGVQPQQAADGDADELLELPALLQRPAGRGPRASLHGRLITPATALLLSHRGGAQRCSMHTAAAEAGSPGRGRLSQEPPRRKRWTRSAPRRCSSQDAGRAGSPVCCSSPQRRGGGNNKPRLQKAAATGAKSRTGLGKKPRLQGEKAAKRYGGGGKKPRTKPRVLGQKAAAAKAAAAGSKKPQKATTTGAKSLGCGGKKPQKAVGAGEKAATTGQNALAAGVKTAKSRGGGGKRPQKAAAAGLKSRST
ncbi:uncharacterized protein LOC115834254 [Nomascus leucogenys]|uniref:uncharacterized protein LOC115834254 n=1 Tax=Nomascus leucogenys TaxID=61853 RepID=UPI00122D74A0|nr:uncharacterized protein LOC115834254 [Nomascus leucogenys]